MIFSRIPTQSEFPSPLPALAPNPPFYSKNQWIKTGCSYTGGQNREDTPPADANPSIQQEVVLEIFLSNQGTWMTRQNGNTGGKGPWMGGREGPGGAPQHRRVRIGKQQ
jgi:hypothetical protein